MPLLKDCVDQKRFDVRLIEKNMARGFVQIKETDDMINELPDDAEHATWVNVEELQAQEDSKS